MKSIIRPLSVSVLSGLASDCCSGNSNVAVQKLTGSTSNSSAPSRSARYYIRANIKLRPGAASAELQPFPPPPLTFSLLAQVAMEHALMAVAMSPSRFPAASDLDRVADEVYAARTLFGAEGWLDDPGSYHRTPPALEEDDLTWHRGRALGIAYEQMSFESRFAPRSGEPGAALGVVRRQPRGCSHHRAAPRCRAAVARLRSRLLHGLSGDGLRRPANRPAPPRARPERGAACSAAPWSTQGDAVERLASCASVVWLIWFNVTGR